MLMMILWRLLLGEDNCMCSDICDVCRADTPSPPFWVFTMQLGPLKSPFLPAVWAEHTWKSFEWFWFWQNKAQWTASLVKTAINFSCSCQCFNRSVRICAMYGKIDECINTAVIHILWCLKLLLVMEPTDRTSGLELSDRIGSGRTKTCTKCSERCDKQLCENLWVQKQIFLQFSSNHSKYSKNTFYMLKASFWYLNQPDWTSGIGFFTQIRLRLAQKFSEWWDKQLCVKSFWVRKRFPTIFTQSLQSF